MLAFNFCTKYECSLAIIHDWTQIATELACYMYGYMDDLTTEHSSDSQATCVNDVLGLCFDILSTSVFIIRNWQMSGRLVQESNACTVTAHRCVLV